MNVDSSRAVRSRASLWWTVGCLGIALAPSQHVTAEVLNAGKLTLTLLDRGIGNFQQSLAKPYTLGYFDTESESFSGALIGVDWNGRLYFSDPIAPMEYALKCFDSEGRFVEAWGPLHCDGIQCCAVTRDGYVWVATWPQHVYAVPGLPVVVYRRGVSPPVIDWRQEMPDAVAEAIRRSVEGAGFAWKEEHESWFPFSLQAGARRVLFVFEGGLIGPENGQARTLWLLVSENGAQALRAGYSGREGRILSPSGEVWSCRNDLDVETWTWSKVWLWPMGQPRGGPLIDRTQVLEPWPKDLTLGKTLPPKVLLDAKHIYLLWQRHRSTRRDGDDFPCPSLDCYAATMLDVNRRPVAHLPWRPGDRRWLIKPVPDGRGFYRYEHDNKESRIYFHPLPR